MAWEDHDRGLCKQGWRAPADRKAAKRRALASVDAAVARLRQRLEELENQLKELPRRGGSCRVLPRRPTALLLRLRDPVSQSASPEGLQLIQCAQKVPTK